MVASKKILHLCGTDPKFIPPFIAFVRKYFNSESHRFLICGNASVAGLPADKNILHFASIPKSVFRIMREIRLADKVIVHGIFSSYLLYVFALQPWLLGKFYWTIWGADLYGYHDRKVSMRNRFEHLLKRQIIKRFGHFITHVLGDYELARVWYGARGQWHDCFMYPSNVYPDYEVQPIAHKGINILLGNSASRTNCHADALQRLVPYVGGDIRIYCPLSYGDVEYADEVEAMGRNMFGEKFIPLRDFMPFEHYLDLLAKIDIGVFNHNRQQAMGNITMLLGLGKQVFIRPSLTSASFFSSIGVDVGNIDQLPANLLDRELDAKINMARIRDHFSLERLVYQLREVMG